MIEKGPFVVKESSISLAWLRAIKILLENKKEVFNLIVQIKRPKFSNDDIYKNYAKICSKYNLKLVRDISYTIFPDTLYIKNSKGRMKKLFKNYARIYPRIKTSWGTYFHRLVSWEFSKGYDFINQLEKVINNLKKRQKIYKSAYFMVLCTPGNNFDRPIGAPCLHYLALQIEPSVREINLLAVYRNHFFIQRAYGNYIGLSYLLKFICKHSNYKMGDLVCISSHACIESSGPLVTDFKKIISKYL